MDVGQLLHTIHAIDASKKVPWHNVRRQKQSCSIYICTLLYR